MDRNHISSALDDVLQTVTREENVYEHDVGDADVSGTVQVTWKEGLLQDSLRNVTVSIERENSDETYRIGTGYVPSGSRSRKKVYYLHRDIETTVSTEAFQSAEVGAHIPGLPVVHAYEEHDAVLDYDFMNDHPVHPGPCRVSVSDLSLTAPDEDIAADMTLHYAEEEDHLEFGTAIDVVEEETGIPIDEYL